MRIDNPDVEITMTKNEVDTSFVGKAVGSGTFELTDTGEILTGSGSANGNGGDAGNGVGCYDCFGWDGAPWDYWWAVGHLDTDGNCDFSVSKEFFTSQIDFVDGPVVEEFTITGAVTDDNCVEVSAPLSR